jgi:hypothetical protein
MTDEFENALAWFCSAPNDWIESGRKNLAAGAEWVWQVIQGDFNDDQSTGQVVTGTIISMIPFVDQICDVRDICANCGKIKQEPDKPWHWFSLVLTLIGLFPTLGSLVKGCLKVAFASVRKAGTVSKVIPKTELLLGSAVTHINNFLSRPEVAKAIKALNWDNPRKILAKELKKVAAKINTSALLGGLDDGISAAQSLLNLVRKWGSDALATRAGELLTTLKDVRRMADQKIGQALQPVQDFLNQLARRLEIDSDMAHRAYLDTVNPHAFQKVANETEEAAEFAKARPAWVDDTGLIVNESLRVPPAQRKGWPSTVSYDTFHTMQPLTLPPGTVLYRIVDPTSKDNSICWMTKAEFEQLRSKDDWRRRFAVWAHWNSNGEYVTYVVPPGPGLNVWEGVTASQKLDGTKYVLEGGARQMVVKPADLNPTYLSKRNKTRWGYDDLGKTNTLVGVPVQKNHLIK